MDYSMAAVTAGWRGDTLAASKEQSSAVLWDYCSVAPWVDWLVESTVGWWAANSDVSWAAAMAGWRDDPLAVQSVLYWVVRTVVLKDAATVVLMVDNLVFLLVDWLGFGLNLKYSVKNEAISIYSEIERIVWGLLSYHQSNK